MVARNPVSIISAETGAGKSTQIPQYLLEAGYDEIVVTVPSRAAATSLATRVSSELGSPLGELVGYHTAYERSTSLRTRILFTTEGMQLIKELLHKEKGFKNRVLILDEAQEWSVNTETLVAYVRNQIIEGWNTKVILMSASMDTESVSEFFNDAPILKIEGKLFNITEYTAAPRNFETIIHDLAKNGRNVLAFVPGKAEIDSTIKTLIELHTPGTILPLHADLPIEEQQRVFDEITDSKIIVATNVAQTSITIPDIDAVVDSGLERRMMLIDGQNTLAIGTISRSDMIQRKGRGARTRDGIYYWCNIDSRDTLQEYPTPDIYTSNLDQVVLRLASVDENALDVTFFHQPDEENIFNSQKRLRLLGALDNNNKITAIGETMNRLPVDARYSRMIIEAHKLNVLSDVAIIAAIQTLGCLKEHTTKYSEFTTEIHSDLLAELDCFKKVQSRLMSGGLDVYSSTSENYAFKGINKKTYFRVLELRTKLYDVLEMIYGDVSSSGNRSDIIKACLAGIPDLLYRRESNGWYRNPADETPRKLNLHSAIIPTNFVFGIPKNISFSSVSGTQITLYILSSATSVNPNTLHDLAPELISKELGDVSYDLQTNSYTQNIDTKFCNVVIDTHTEPVTDLDTKRKALAKWLAKQTDNFVSKTSKNPQHLLEIFQRNQRIFKKRYYDEFDMYSFYYQVLLENYNNYVPNLKKSSSVKPLAIGPNGI